MNIALDCRYRLSQPCPYSPGTTFSLRVTHCGPQIRWRSLVIRDLNKHKWEITLLPALPPVGDHGAEYFVVNRSASRARIGLSLVPDCALDPIGGCGCNHPVVKSSRPPGCWFRPPGVLGFRLMRFLGCLVRALYRRLARVPYPCAHPSSRPRRKTPASAKRPPSILESLSRLPPASRPRSNR